MGVRGADRREAQLPALLASPGGSSLSRQGRCQGLRRLCCRGSPSGPRLETPDRSSGHSQPLALWQQGQQALWGETAAACVVTTPAEKLPLDASSRQSLAPRAGSTAVPCMGRGAPMGEIPPACLSHCSPAGAGSEAALSTPRKPETQVPHQAVNKGETWPPRTCREPVMGASRQLCRPHRGDWGRGCFRLRARTLADPEGGGGSTHSGHREPPA